MSFMSSLHKSFSHGLRLAVLRPSSHGCHFSVSQSLIKTSPHTIVRYGLLVCRHKYFALANNIYIRYRFILQ